MLEENRQESLREIKRVNNDEAIVGSSPGDEIISGRIIDHLISLDDERRDDVVVLGDIH